MRGGIAEANRIISGSISSLLLILPFVFLILAGVLVVVHLKHVRGKKREKVARKFDRWVYVIGLLGPLAALPQIYQIWILQSAAGISLTSWVLYLGFAFVWLGYGVVHRYNPVIVSNSLWIVFEAIIIAGVFVF